MTQRPTALVTGASSGIGKEFARVFAREGYDLVLVARSENRLVELATELRSTYGAEARVIPKDLAVPSSPEEIFHELERAGAKVDVLVNNAGFGALGEFEKLPWERQESMIRVNVVSLARLTGLFLPSMLERGNGGVLNVASGAAFLPGPLMATYYATKAFVLSFTESIAGEHRGSGLKFSVLCPGPTKSGFGETAGTSQNGLYLGRGLPTSREVAEYGYRAWNRGKLVAIHSLPLKLGVQLLKFIPLGMQLRFIKKYQENKKTAQ